MSATNDMARALAPVFRDALAENATVRRRRDVLTVTWAKGKASGRCPHCETGHMEPRRARPLGGTSEADFMVCVGGCGRTEAR